MNKTSFLMGNLKSKTSWFGIVLIVLGTIYDQWQMILELIPDKYEGAIYSLIGLVILVLRNLTNESIEEKGTPTTSDEGE